MKKSGYLRYLIFFLAVALLAGGSLAWGEEQLTGKEQHIKLLAVQETEKGYKGSLADLSLELKEGSGRVFLETFPLTKMDTQISTRFAKDIACDYFGLECEKYDFIYTIKAETNIVGGPSAGAAMAALTAVTLLELEYDPETTITGTINSGGTIGPVGGIKEKLEAASQNSLKKVLIAKGSGQIREEGNLTFDLKKYGQENLSLEVEEVGNLNEVIWELTGKKTEKNISLEINKDYEETMKELSGLLCGRTEELEKELEKFKVEEGELKEISEKKNSSKASLEKGEPYSAASFCFGANILIKELIYKKEGRGLGWVISELNRLRKKAELLEEKLKKEKIETISDLQARMVVEERLDEVRERIEDFQESENKEYALAYAEERFFSAISWMYFFKMEGKKMAFDEEKMEESCRKKIAEGEERYQYVELVFGGLNAKGIREGLEKAKRSSEEGKPVLCLIKAIQAKAEANAILGSMGLVEENVGEFLGSKLKAVEKVIGENNAEGVFPILGYSYYQYAKTLKEKEEEKYTAMLYLEYALEMSELDIYFEEEGTEGIFKGELLGKGGKLEISKEQLYFGGGVGVGAGLVLLVLGAKKLLGKRKRRDTHRQKR